jgi:RNA 3'-terminal phosphate cyclase (ATP)
VIEIDGSQKSGSGTIVRYTATIASLLSKDVHLINIRAKRKKPGLRPQHLKTLETCCELTNGRLEGARVKANEIVYRPGDRINAGEYNWDIGTAGSTTMLAQAILPIAGFAQSPSHIQITGGLFQDFAPAAHHLQYIVLPLLQRMGISIELRVIRPGYVPYGNGVIELIVQPVIGKLKPLVLENQGKIVSMQGLALSSHLKHRSVSERMAETCNEILGKHGYHADIDCIYDTSATQRGASLTVYALTDTGCIIGSDLAGRLGRTSEYIGEKVAKNLLQDIKSSATVDRYTADQLILYAVLAAGSSKYIIPRLTEHIETNIWLVETLLGAKVEYKDRELIIHGIGYTGKK